MSFLWSTGCRVGEMVNIKLTDCIFDCKELFITVLGKGKKERTFPVSLSTYSEAISVFNGKTYLFEH